MANSLVGTSISTRVAEPRVGRYNNLSNTGSMYAAVLPDSKDKKDIFIVHDYQIAHLFQWLHWHKYLYPAKQLV